MTGVHVLIIISDQYSLLRYIIRYENIPLFDHSRVHLKNYTTTYIHANWVDGFDRKRAYIATQGLQR